VLHLETNRTLAEAQALYPKEGYIEVDAFNEETLRPSLVRERLQPIPADDRETLGMESQL